MALAKKKATKKATKKKVPTKSKVTAATKKTKKKTTAARRASKVVTPVERYQLIETTAYFKAEKAGFAGDPAQYWTMAEKEVDARLSGKKRKAKK